MGLPFERNKHWPFFILYLNCLTFIYKNITYMYIYTYMWAFLVAVVCLLSHVQLCDPMDCSPSGSSVHGISQTRILQWLPFPSLGKLPNPGIKSVSLALADGFFTAETPRNTYIWASLVAQWWRIHLQCRRPGFDLWVGKMPWRRKWQLTPVFLPGKSHGQRSLVVTVHGVAKS